MSCRRRLFEACKYGYKVCSATNKMYSTFNAAQECVEALVQADPDVSYQDDEGK